MNFNLSFKRIFYLIMFLMILFPSMDYINIDAGLALNVFMITTCVGCVFASVSSSEPSSKFQSKYYILILMTLLVLTLAVLFELMFGVTSHHPLIPSWVMIVFFSALSLAITSMITTSIHAHIRVLKK